MGGDRPLPRYVAIPTAVAIVVAAALVSGWGLGLFPAVVSTTPTGYTVAFTENGLPAGTPWSVTLGNRTSEGQAPNSISFSMPSGSYSYGVASVPGYSQTPVAGSVSVNGGPAEVLVNFTNGGTGPGPVPPIQHVVVVMLENGDLNTILSYAPYLHYLWNAYGHATEFYPVCHGSYPDYVSVTNGRYFECGANIPVENSQNLPDALEAKSLTWGGYFESMPVPCDQQWMGQSYDPAHNPFLVSEDIVGNPSRCDAHVVNSAQFNSSVASGNLPAFSFYAPNTIDDGEYSNLTASDVWLQNFLSPMLNSSSPTVQQLMAHTAFFVVFDEGLDYKGYSVGGILNSYCQSQTGTALTVCGGHTYLSVISPYSHGTAYTSYATDYSIESTIEWILGVGSDGGYDGTANFPAMASLFSSS